MLGLLTMGSCKDKKEKKAETETEQVEEQEDSNAEEQTATLDETADEDDMDAETELTPEQLEAYENEVWTSLGGLYGFVGEGYEWVGLETGISEDDEKWLSLSGEDDNYPVTIDYKTGNIKAYDDDGNLVFEGYCTKGGNMLRGKLWGKDVKFEGACGQ